MSALDTALYQLVKNAVLDALHEQQPGASEAAPSNVVQHPAAQMAPPAATPPPAAAAPSHSGYSAPPPAPEPAPGAPPAAAMPAPGAPPAAAMPAPGAPPAAAMPAPGAPPAAAPTAQATLDQVRAKANDFARAQPARMAEFQAFIASAGATSLADMQPQFYGAALAKLTELMGG